MSPSVQGSHSTVPTSKSEFWAPSALRGTCMIPRVGQTDELHRCSQPPQRLNAVMTPGSQGTFVSGSHDSPFRDIYPYSVYQASSTHPSHEDNDIVCAKFFTYAHKDALRIHLQARISPVMSTQAQVLHAYTHMRSFFLLLHQPLLAEYAPALAASSYETF